MTHRTVSLSSTMHSAKRAFTLIELLVVVAIIATLISILLPSLNMARKSARTVKCLSNTKQWGAGTLMWSDDNRGDLPWDGTREDDIGQVVDNDGTRIFEVDYFYANAVPPYIASERYVDIMKSAQAQGRAQDVPLPASDSIFTCPSAKLPVAGVDTQPGVAPYPIENTPYYYYFNYVINSKLENGSRARWPINLNSNPEGEEKARLSDIRFPAATVLLFGIRASYTELPLHLRNDDDEYDKRLDRIHAKWVEMAYRHQKGASTLFADSSARVVDFEYANTKQDYDYMGQMLKLNTRYGPRQGYNQPDLIWTPLGVAQ